MAEQIFTIVAIAVLAFAPGVFWLWYFYRKDKIEPEPKLLVLKMFGLGMLIALPVVVAELLVASDVVAVYIGWGAMSAVIVAPIIEEYAKYLVVRHTIYEHPEFDEPMDGIVYAAATALGFASVENVLYLVGAYLSPGETLQTSEPMSPFAAVLLVFAVRALLSVPGHALFSSMWGYALGRAKFTDQSAGARIVIKGLLLAMGLHAVFNALVVFIPAASIGMLILVAVMWRMVHRRINQALIDSPHKATEDNE